MRCRLLPHLVLDGPAQMALDQALLEAVAEDPSAAVFRTYQWSEPTLSLGYFQKVAEVEADPRWAGVPVVRRPTGGGAILHDRELTYALVLPRSHPRVRTAADLYAAVHGAIGQALQERGVPVLRRGHVHLGEKRPRPLLCFTDRDPEDMVIDDVKILGSAQRRRPDAVLQHGSLLLDSSVKAPELRGLANLLPVDASPLAWSLVLRKHVPAALGLSPRDEEVPATARPRAELLERTVYRSDDWTRRR
jgi:lipoate-protein ligase A